MRPPLHLRPCSALLVVTVNHQMWNSGISSGGIHIRNGIILNFVSFEKFNAQIQFLWLFSGWIFNFSHKGKTFYPNGKWSKHCDMDFDINFHILEMPGFWEFLEPPPSLRKLTVVCSVVKLVIFGPPTPFWSGLKRICGYDSAFLGISQTSAKSSSRVFICSAGCFKVNMLQCTSKLCTFDHCLGFFSLDK